MHLLRYLREMPYLIFLQLSSSISHPFHLTLSFFFYINHRSAIIYLPFLQLSPPLQCHFFHIINPTIHTYRFFTSDMEQGKQQEQLKKFNFFVAEPVTEQVSDPKNHPIKLTELRVTDIIQVKSKVLLLEEERNRVLIFSRGIEAEWQPNSEATWKLTSTALSNNEVIITYGEDADQQSKSVYIKLWTIDEGILNWQALKPRRQILIGKLGEPENIVSSIHLLNDCTALVVGTKRGTLSVYESKNLLDHDAKQSNKVFDKKDIRLARLTRRANETDIYYSNDESFFWFENMSEKKRIVQTAVELMEVGRTGNILLCFRDDNRTIYEYRSGKEVRAHALEGQKKLIREFRSNYLVVVTFEKKNEKNEKSSDKYFVHILDTVNQYIAFYEAYSKVEAVLTNDTAISIVALNQKSERSILTLTERDNSFKIETFFKRSFYNEAWKFAKNQNCQQSLLAEISRLHGDLLYSKSDYAGAIRQYILTLGFVEPSYVIRKFLDVSQIDYLIDYLQKIHEKKVAKKEHTALLLNCYVKKQKIENLSHFLSDGSLQSDLFDIETAIKVCKDLTHYDEAMKLAEQKNKYELYLKILIENKKDYERALEYIRTKVPLEEKEKYVIEFGQEFMKFLSKKTIELIKLLIRAHSISQIVRGKERDYVLSPEERSVFQKLNYNTDELENLTIITFKKPDEFFRLFLTNNEELETFLLHLIRDVPRLPHEQIVFHRLIEFYLEMMKEHPSRREEYAEKILEQLQNTSKKPDNNVLLSLFKMYDFDEGIITLCRRLGMREDLLNFYIARTKDREIIDLCKEHGVDEVNLWIHALKYFVKPELRKEHFVPEILNELSKIPNLSPLPVLNILAKSKNIEYQYIKNFFLQKLKEDRYNVEKDRDIVRKNIRKAEQSRAEFKKLKTTAKPFLSNNCSHCQNGLTFPSIYFMCGHSFHENCLGGERECSKCRFDMRSIIERKERYAEAVQDQTKLFENLQERKESGFEVVAEFLGKGLFVTR